MNKFTCAICHFLWPKQTKVIDKSIFDVDDLNSYEFLAELAV